MSTDYYDALIQLVRDEMRTGFAGVHERLDRINGTVRHHSEQIAVLDHQSEIALRAAEHFTAHRARCPFESIEGQPNLDLDVLLGKRKRDYALSASLGAALAAAAIEGFPRLLSLFRP